MYVGKSVHFISMSEKVYSLFSCRKYDFRKNGHRKYGYRKNGHRKKVAAPLTDLTSCMCVMAENNNNHNNSNSSAQSHFVAILVAFLTTATTAGVARVQS
jgi:hypothetical protein